MKRFLYSTVLIGAMARHAGACDICAIFSATEAQNERGRGFFGGVAEQYTHFGAVQDDGHSAASSGQYIESSVSQVFAGYNFNNRFNLQLNLPVIYREFGSQPTHGTESGIGDLTLLGNYNVFTKFSDTYSVILTLTGGMKFPTGDSSRLNTPDEDLPEGIGGHDLALGSGSYDGLVGTSIFSRWKRAFATASVQYAIRSEGDFHHQYANDLSWFGGPGAYAILNDDYTLSIQAVVSGETKGKDTFSGVPDEDSAETLVYLGPQINFTWGSNISGLLAADIPVSRDNSGTQVLPDYRIRAAVTFRF
jgi:hypothetical protein